MKSELLDIYISTLYNISKQEKARIYLVGGAVRDFFLKKDINDYDFVIFGNTDSVVEKFVKQFNCKFIKYEKKLVTYRIFCRLKTIDITNPRGKSIEEDLSRRDFTINSIAYDFENDKIIDPQNGIKDIKRKTIRINFKDSFKDDPVRILRTFRLASLFRFDISAKTLKIAQNSVELLNLVSKERITEELRKFFGLNNTFTYLLLMDRVGVIDTLFEDLSLTNGCIQSEHHLFDVKTHSLNVYNFIEWSHNRLYRILGKCYKKYSSHITDNHNVVMSSMKLAALFHDAGKPFSKFVDDSNRVHFPKHEQKSAELFVKYAKIYSFGNNITKLTKFFIEKHIEPSYMFSMWSKKKLKEIIVVDFFLDYKEYGIDLLFFALADTLAKGKISANNREIYIDFLKKMAQFFYHKIKPRLKEKTLIDGNYILENFPCIDKKNIKFILKEVKKAQILNIIKSKEDATLMVKELKTVGAAAKNDSR